MLSIADFYGVPPNSEDLKNTTAEIKPALQLMKSKIDSVFASYKTVKTINSCWYRPKETVLADRKFVNLFSDLSPLNETEKPLHYTLTEIPDRSQIFLKEHAHYLNKNHVISTLKRIQGQNRLIDWHKRVIVYIANFKDKLKPDWDRKSFLEDLKKVPILPTAKGVIAASCDKEFRVLCLPEKEESVPLELFEDQSRFLDINLAKRFVESKSSEDRSLWQARILLKELSPEITVQKLYDEFISPIFKEQKWSGVNEERLLKLTKFIKDHFDSIKNPEVKLKSVSGKFVKPEQLYLTSSFDQGCPFEKLINSKDRLISDDYLNLDTEQSIEEKRTQWREFLVKVGVIRIPKVTEQKPIEINKKDLELRLTRPPEESTKRGYKIIEQELDPEICSIFEENTLYALQDRIECAKILIKLFNENWNSYKDKLKAYYQFHIRGAEEWPIEELGNSKFAQWILETRWIPTKSGKLCTSSEVVGSEEKVAVAISAAFEGFLFGTTLNLNTLCRRLFEVIEQKVTDPKSYYELYNQIHRSWRKADEDEQYQITELLKKQPSIFIDNSQPQWLKPTDVVWKARSWLRVIVLNKLYEQKCKNWFTDMFGVPEEPTPIHYIDYATNNLWNRNLDPNLKSVWRNILSKIEEILDENHSEIENLEWLKRNLKYFCFNHGWVAASESLFYDDNGTLTGNEEFTIEMKIIQPLGEEPFFQCCMKHWEFNL